MNKPKELNNVQLLQNRNLSCFVVGNIVICFNYTECFIGLNQLSHNGLGYGACRFLLLDFSIYAYSHLMFNCHIYN